MENQAIPFEVGPGKLVKAGGRSSPASLGRSPGENRCSIINIRNVCDDKSQN